MISVIVPIYNAEQYLRTCVESICGQTYHDLEIILVNDGSTDHSLDICNALAEKDNRIEVIHKQNSGPSESRNMGLDIAKGEYIAFVDSDDCMHPRMLEILLSALIDTDSDIAMCDFQYADNQYAKLQERENSDIKIYKEDEMFELLWSENVKIVVQWNKLYKKKIFSDLRFPVGKINEDTYIAHRQLNHCKQLVYVDQKLYVYVQRPGSIMATMSRKRINDTIEAYEDRIRFFLERNRYKEAERTKKSMLDDLLYFAEQQYKNKQYNILKYTKKRFRSCYRRYWKNAIAKEYVLFYINCKWYMSYKKVSM